MKTKIILLLLTCWVGVAWGQISVDSKNKTIRINADSDVKIFEILLEYNKNEENCYQMILHNPKKYGFSMRINATLQDKLSIDNTIKSEREGRDEDSLGEKCFKRNTEYTFTITADQDPKERIYKIKTQTDWTWTTSFGANAIFFTNRSKYISQKNENGELVISQIQDNKQMDLMPTVMFTFLNNQKTVSPGFSGGLGLNFEEVSVFLGGSLGFGQNIIVTAGVGVHKQMRPNSVYSVGQQLSAEITTDQLNDKQYRVNPFIGISYRLDKNPFSK